MTMAQQQKWVADLAHSEVSFRVKHLMVSHVTGYFRKFHVEAHASAEGFQDARILFTAQVDSIETGNADRDAHLKGPDFFDAAKYPEIRFVSTAFRKLNDEGDYELHGELTMKGITRPVSFQVHYEGSVKDPWGNQKAGFSVQGRINRKEWGLNWNAALETGGVVVSEDVRVAAELQMLQQVPAESLA